MPSEPSDQPIPYLGSYVQAVDDGGRIFMPPKWRESERKLWLIPLGRYLSAISDQMFQTVMAKVSTASLGDPKGLALQRMLGAHAESIELDKRGRFRISEQSRRLVGISRDAMLVGRLDRFEIWNPKQFAGETEEKPFDALKDDWMESLYTHKGKELPASTQCLIVGIREEIKKFFSKHPEKLHKVSPRFFEQLVAEILKDMGFDVELTKATRDGGVDIYAYLRHEVGSFLTLVECKKLHPEHPVGIEVVQRLYGIQQTKQANKSMIVTTSFFSAPAKKEAELHSGLLELKDYGDLKNWLKHYSAETTTPWTSI